MGKTERVFSYQRHRAAERPAVGTDLVHKPQNDRYQPFMTISSQCLRNPEIEIYLADNSEVVLAAKPLTDCLGDKYRPVLFLWWGHEIPKSLKILYTDIKSRPVVHTWVGRNRDVAVCM